MSEIKIEQRLNNDNLGFLSGLLQESKSYIRGTYIIETILNAHWNKPIEICGIDIDINLIEETLFRYKYRKIAIFYNEFDKEYLQSKIIDKYNLIVQEDLEDLKDDIDETRIFGYKFTNPNNIPIHVFNFKSTKELYETALNIENIYYDGKNIEDKENVLESIQKKICYLNEMDDRFDILKKVFFYTSKKFFVDFSKVLDYLKKLDIESIQIYNVAYWEYARKLSKVYVIKHISGILIPYFHARFKDNLIFGYNVNIHNTVPLKRRVKYKLFSVKILSNRLIHFVTNEIKDKSTLELLTHKYGPDIGEQIGSFLDEGRIIEEEPEEWFDRQYYNGWN